ncbi:uncharacterized protein [Manis javanica]|uniref:uncharacterized protein isoform X1 n=1 Tax=Manis javanica TaxID=9974 RepID=UPI003C6D5BEC
MAAPLDPAQVSGRSPRLPLSDPQRRGPAARTCGRTVTFDPSPYLLPAVSRSARMGSPRLRVRNPGHPIPKPELTHLLERGQQLWPVRRDLLAQSTSPATGVPLSEPSGESQVPLSVPFRLFRQRACIFGQHPHPNHLSQMPPPSPASHSSLCCLRCCVSRACLARHPQELHRHLARLSPSFAWMMLEPPTLPAHISVPLCSSVPCTSRCTHSDLV